MYAIEEYNKVILVKMNDKKMWEFELYENATSDEISVMSAYDALNRASTETDINNVKTQITNLPDSIIKTALQNRMEYRW